jgi:hypothetical protein
MLCMLTPSGRLAASCAAQGAACRTGVRIDLRARQIKKGQNFCSAPFLFGAPGGIRTPDQLVRSQLLYPAELRARKRCRQDAGMIPK